MKKIAVVFASVLMLLSLVFSVFAEEMDCRNISEEERRLVDAANTNTLIRIYNGSFFHGFAAHDGIEDLTSSKYVLEEIIVSYRPNDFGSVDCYRVNQSTAEKVNGLDSAASVFAQYTSERMVDKLEKKTKAPIRSIICLCGETSHDGIFLYYRTDSQDYVLYKEYASSDKVYFFEAGDFYVIAKKYYEEKQRVLYDPSGEVRKGAGLQLQDVVDLKKYELPTNHVWQIVLTSSMMGAAILLSIVLLMRVKKSRHKSQMTPT